jgi:hypothetical protein
VSQRPKAGIVAAVVVAGVVGLFVIALGGSMALGLETQQHEVVGPTQTKDQASGVAHGRRPGAVRLRAGDCVRRKGTGDPTDLLVVSCNAPHHGEVISTYPFPAGNWPGAAAIAKDAEARCGTHVPANLVTSDREDLATEIIYPEQAGWSAGDRRVECLLVAEQPLNAPLSKL